jgi:hypothetical protein
LYGSESQNASFGTIPRILSSVAKAGYQKQLYRTETLRRQKPIQTGLQLAVDLFDSPHIHGDAE